MKLTQTELQRLLELVLNANMHQQSLELHEKLLSKLSVEFAKKAIEKDPIVDKEEETEELPKLPPTIQDIRHELAKGNSYDFSTARTAKLLKVTESDLRVLRKTKDLKRDFHYITGRSPRPTAVWYDLERTCQLLHEVSWKRFSEDGFDVQANTDRKVARAFERARRNQKK
jgi:hypothetical protein